MKRARPPKRTDAGDTLIEILIAITILGLSGVALLGAFASDLSGASTYKNTTTVETVLKNFAEEATYQIQYQTYPGPLFTACATLSGQATATTNIDYNGTPLTYQPPATSGITIKVTNAMYFNDSTYSFGPLSGCSSSSGSLEPQYFQVSATGPQGAHGTLDFVVASFNYESYGQPS